MKLSVLANLYAQKSLDEALTIFDGLGVHTVEIGSGGYPGKAHCDPAVLLSDAKALADFKETLKRHTTDICALATHGNPVHPDKDIAKAYHDDFVNSVLLAEKLGVDTVVGFSGCPGDCEKSERPNWVVCAWPDDYLETLKWQWEEKLIPYWEKMGKFCRDHGVRVAFEMHQGFCVYNPETCLKLRAAVGDVLGANVDPSHLIWQGMDPVMAIRELSGAIYHFHAKDTRLDPFNVSRNGVLDTKHYGDEINRSWVFRTVGYGNGEKYWRDIVSMLRLCGYDRVLSIEHEDSLMSIDEGLSKAVHFLKDIIIEEPKPGTMAWA